MKDFRNRIIHDYVGIDLVIVFEIITKDLKLLKPQFENIINKNIENKIFDIEELKISKESKYYKNIDFEKLV
ncbi:HepT-like ribonuclease domain-containing protein [Treponema primitia]|uniref:HepT-like ribonuclease domain-containing protein n=1 Tax=Treponema primitia TaxID=88058 RepID=UPI00191C006A